MSGVQIPPCAPKYKKMKQLRGQVTHKYPNGDLIVWFKREQFGSHYFCDDNETDSITDGDWVLCEFDDLTLLGTVNRLKKV
jgi:hypothetical protein